MICFLVKKRLQRICANNNVASRNSFETNLNKDFIWETDASMSWNFFCSDSSYFTQSLVSVRRLRLRLVLINFRYAYVKYFSIYL